MTDHILYPAFLHSKVKFFLQFFQLKLVNDVDGYCLFYSGSI